MGGTFLIQGAPGTPSYAVETVSSENIPDDVTLFTLTTSELVPSTVFDNGSFTIEELDGSGGVIGTISGDEDFSYLGEAGPNGGYTYFFQARTSSIVATGAFDPPCFAAGTVIGTVSGGIAVEALRAGDPVRLATGGEAVVRWVGHRRARDAAVIRFRAGSLPVGPVSDLVVSPDHAMYVDGCLVPAELLVDGVGIVREERSAVTFYHVELAAHGILLADGAPAESYFDSGNRRKFANCPIGYDPARPAAEPCAEMVLAGGRLARIRALLASTMPA